jgi:hypothetical protein
VTFDISRAIFEPRNNYSGVVMEQGRVQTDADWNEWLAENARRIQAGTLDIFGRAGYPATTPAAFQITATTTGSKNSISIGAGRMYVDGLLAENHGAAPGMWDPALAELSGAPQPPPASPNTIDYTEQPYYPNPDTSLLSGNGPFLVYLDVWTRAVSWLQDPKLVDPAIAVDTTGRLQTVWQVKLQAVPQGQTWTCHTPDSQIFPAPSTGVLTTGTVEDPTAGPCCLTTGSGYSGLENQCYRVEIHNPGSASDSAAITNATFKWSRDNGSIETGVTNIGQGFNSLNAPAAILTVLSLGRDQVLGFLPGNWIELLDDAHQLNGIKGELYQIDSIDAASRTITLTTQLVAGTAFANGTPQAASYTRIRRWDQSGKVYQADLTTVWWDLDAAGGDGSIPVPAPDTTLVLEAGITVTFGPNGTATFGVGDYWSFAARTADGSVGPLSLAPPFGPHHHTTKLSIVSFNPASNSDCRTAWPPAGGGSAGCCTCTVGEGGKFKSIQKAIDSLPKTGGEVCILPGRYFENIVIENRADIIIHGCGWQTRLASPSLDRNATNQAQPDIIAQSGVAAVITIIGSRHIELRDFAVEAGDGEAGILLDQPVRKRDQEDDYLPYRFELWNMDIALQDLFVTASTSPAIAGIATQLLKIANNRIAMSDQRITWPAVYVSGKEIEVTQNWIGLADAAHILDWVPTTVYNDFAPPLQVPDARNRFGGTPRTRALTPGGIQIGGDSRDVRVTDNDIAGGARNGVTLGSFIVLDKESRDTGRFTGVIPIEGDPCAKTSTNQLPGSIGTGTTKQNLGAGGPLKNIAITGNRIHGFGLNGIGPVGFFNFSEVLEVVSITDLLIAGNIISKTVLETLDGKFTAESIDIAGAICLPDVGNVVIRDNIITDFGATPGAAYAYGIFLLNAENADLSRNQIKETRDWTLVETDPAANNPGGGIGALVTPPALNPASGDGGDNPYNTTIYEPGLPALRIEHNIVRVALGLALEVFGLGPFAIVNNHFATGGTLTVKGWTGALAVAILNLGLAIELDDFSGGYNGLYNGIGISTIGQPRLLASSSNGAVLFTNNICQVEARLNRQRGIASIMIFSLDNLLFADNHSWIDGGTLAADLDVLVFAASVQFNSNRLQEPIGSVYASGLTLGLTNVTTSNVSTACLFAQAMPGKLARANNITAVPNSLCEQFQATLMPKG